MRNAFVLILAFVFLPYTVSAEGLSYHLPDTVKGRFFIKKSFDLSVGLTIPAEDYYGDKKNGISLTAEYSVYPAKFDQRLSFTLEGSYYDVRYKYLDFEHQRTVSSVSVNCDYHLFRQQVISPSIGVGIGVLVSTGGAFWHNGCGSLFTPKVGLTIAERYQLSIKFRKVVCNFPGSNIIRGCNTFVFSVGYSFSFK